jgi:hypothetical protein
MNWNILKYQLVLLTDTLALFRLRKCPEVCDAIDKGGDQFGLLRAPAYSGKTSFATCLKQYIELMTLEYYDLYDIIKFTDYSQTVLYGTLKDR